MITLIQSKVALADQVNDRTRNYKIVEIKAGDSLWSIATQNYTTEYKTVHKYIDSIKKCNALYDDQITAGCYLIIPYYQDADAILITNADTY